MGCEPLPGMEKTKKKWRRYILLVGLFFYPWATVAYYLTSKYLEKKLGNIGIEKMTDIVRELNDKGLIKRNTEGIKTLKESKLYIINSR